MELWIPLLQTLIWPIFFAILLFIKRDWFREFLDVIKRRVESGSEFSLGPKGLKLGTTPKLEEQVTMTSKPPEDLISDFAEETKKRPPVSETALELANQIQLVHSASYNPEWSLREGRPYYTIEVWLEANDPKLLDNVSKVVYYLHPTFPYPVREIFKRDNNFKLTTYAWGQFQLSADVYFGEGEQPLKLFRYLNF